MNEIKEQIMAICGRIKILRKSRKMKQDDLGKIIGVERPTVTRIEKGDITPSIAHMLKIVDHFGVSLDWLFLGKGEMNQKPTPLDFGKYSEDITNMLETMQENQGLMHSILSYFFTQQANFPDEKDNGKDLEVENDR